ncbi:hypothetical protein [Kribbella monticola]|uniref:hypothetical protein n=1 Tax=Kribbella monticola TaxID=2185285 RepID=UPI000DD31FED|nr:hypothetical protein [Kribbella monticola]
MSSTLATSTLTAATHGSALAATAHGIAQAATVALIVTVSIAFYLFTCLVWPFGKCCRCKGAGKFKSPFGNAYRHCGKCEGSGLRVRVGRKVINYYRRTRAGADNATSKGGRK